MLSQVRPPRLRSLGGTPTGKCDHGRSLTRRCPRRHPPPGAQHADQLGLTKLIVSARCGRRDGLRQQAARNQCVQGTACREPGAGRTTPQVMQEPCRNRLVLARPRASQVIGPDISWKTGQPRGVIVRIALRVAQVTRKPAVVYPVGVRPGVSGPFPDSGPRSSARSALKDGPAADLAARPAEAGDSGSPRSSWPATTTEYSPTGVTASQAHRHLFGHTIDRL